MVWVVVSNIFYFQPEPWGNSIQFDEHIFQMGWFNHQVDGIFTYIFSIKINPQCRKNIPKNMEHLGILKKLHFFHSKNTTSFLLGWMDGS